MEEGASSEYGVVRRRSSDRRKSSGSSKDIDRRRSSGEARQRRDQSSRKLSGGEKNIGDWGEATNFGNIVYALGLLLAGLWLVGVVYMVYHAKGKPENERDL
jgi:hypothetical protein